jgi:small subunit ribosomal protein S6
LLRNLSRAPRLYELMTILSPDVPEEELAGSLDRIASYVTEAGGTVNETLRESPWGRRRLAYPIRYSGRDVRDGFYAVYHFELDPARVDDVERELRLNDRVIRYLVTHYVPVPIDESEAEASGAAAEAQAPPASAEAVEDTAPAAEAPPVAADESDEPSAARTETPADVPAVTEGGSEEADDSAAAESGEDNAGTATDEANEQ